MRPKFGPVYALFAALAFFTACAAPPLPNSTPTSTQAVTLTPYTPPARAETSVDVTPSPAPPLPSPSPTPRTHAVVKGEDLFGIALRYGLTVEELKAANPDVNPNLLSIGTLLVIPGGGRAEPTPANPTPTPLTIQLGGPDCWSAADGSVTCFVLATNPGPGTLENLAVLVRAAAQNGETLEQEAYGLLNLLPAGESLPLVVTFSPEQGANARASSEILRAFPLPEGDTRYLATVLRDVVIEIAPDGRSAAVRGVALASGTQTAQTAWVVVWGSDAQGRLVAARRWESASPLSGDSGAPFELRLYSLGGPITEVKLLAEARP